MNASKFVLFLLLILLAGCRGIATQTPPAFEPKPRPDFPNPDQSQPTRAETLPETVVGLATATPVIETPTQPPASTPTGLPASTPAAPGEPGAGPVAEIPGPAVAGVQPAAAYSDCARTPGLVSCAAGAAEIPARLAFYDSSAGRLVAADLESGAGWQTQAEAVGLEWSPDGEQLLALTADDQAQVFDAQGRLLETFAADEEVYWQPDGRLARGERQVFAMDGRAAWLEQSQGAAVLHVRAADGSLSAPVQLHPQPPDRLYALIDWVPGTSEILAYAYFAGNSAMTVGGDLVTLDALTGAEQPLGVTAPMGKNAEFAWNPNQPGLLAFIVTTGEPGDPVAAQLALHDFRNGDQRFPLPYGVQVSGFTWSPDGARMAFAARPPASAPDPIKQAFPAPGIYTLDPQTDKVEPLTSPPQNAADGWPHWLSDGQVLVYGREIAGPDGQSLVQVRARQMSDGTEWVLVDGLPADQDWSKLLAVTEK